ncbi:MAG: tRNA adenosine(34) deaminase TadA [Candidatus Dasytiphilus stammeri]
MFFLEDINIKLSNDIEDEYWMNWALKLANHACKLGEVPVGAVIVRNKIILSEGWNCSISFNDPTAHAEIIALRRAGQILSNYRLLNTTLYVTLEPCLMCMGAIAHSRVTRLVFGACDKKYGATKLFQEKKISKFHHPLKLTGNVLGIKCSNLLKNFFQHCRHKKIKS